jgi:hypothetical protein
MVLVSVIEHNLTTALILEDDADWDFRLHSQLEKASHAIRKIPDLIAESEVHASRHPPSADEKLSQLDLAKRSSVTLPSFSSRSIPVAAPYGRSWDVLWLGHCGAALPPPSPHSPNRILMPKDSTIPEPQYLKPMPNAPLDKMASLYPPHSRVVHRTNTTLCTVAYAVTQAGARKLLYEFGIREFSQGFDFALSDWCNGKTRPQREQKEEAEGLGRGMPMCVVVQPPIFGHWFEGGRHGSDIMGPGAGGVPQRETRYVKRSVRLNLEALVKGEDIVEQWPDTDGSS